MNDYDTLNKRLQSIIAEMQKIQRGIRGSKQPASSHELDALTRLGTEYSQVTTQLAALSKPTNTNQKS